MSGPTDCLTLKIQEYDIDDNTLDTTLYIIYDKKEHHYVLRGKRNDKTLKSEAFSFNCEFAHELIDFITFVICKKNNWSYILYNYDNLPATSDEITYDFMKVNESVVYELGGYEKQKYNKTVVLKYLRILRNVFNNYN
jgi:hypothetical protein